VPCKAAWIVRIRRSSAASLVLGIGGGLACRGSRADQATAADVVDGTNGGLPIERLTFARGEVATDLVMRVRNDDIVAQHEATSVTLSAVTARFNLHVRALFA
jgi:hypothetical protein